MRSFVKHIALLSISVLMLTALSGCGRIKSADELYKLAVRTYGECEIVSQTENEDGTVLVLRDNLQGFEYKMTSGMNDIVIDGSSFGSVENTGSTFSKALSEYVFSQCLDELETICEEAGGTCDTEDVSFFIIRTETAEEAEKAALACAEVIQAYNLQGRMDNWELACYQGDGSTHTYSVRFGSVKLPNIEWISHEQEIINYYSEMARMVTDEKAQYVRSEEGIFSQTGADIDRVVQVLGTDYPTEGSSPVTFYFFRASDGTEYYLCDFNYYDDDHYNYSWFTNYADVVPEEKK